MRKKKYEKKPEIKKEKVEIKKEKKPVDRNTRKSDKSTSQPKNKNTNSNWKDPRESRRADRFSDSNKSTSPRSSSQKEKDRLDHKKTGTLHTVKKTVEFGVKDMTEILTADKKAVNSPSNNKSTPSAPTERKKGLTLPKGPSEVSFGVKSIEELLPEKNQPTPAPQEPKPVVTQTSKYLISNFLFLSPMIRIGGSSFLNFATQIQTFFPICSTEGNLFLFFYNFSVTNLQNYANLI